MTNITLADCWGRERAEERKGRRRREQDQKENWEKECQEKGREEEKKRGKRGRKEGDREERWKEGENGVNLGQWCSLKLLCCCVLCVYLVIKVF